MNAPIRLCGKLHALISQLQSPFLLLVRLFWGWQFLIDGWGKLHHLARVGSFFASLGVPFPASTALCISALEFVGGILLIAGLASRIVAFLLTCNMLAAYWTASRDTLSSIFSIDASKFYSADPYPFLFASLVILIFGAGWISLDAVLEARCRAWVKA